MMNRTYLAAAALAVTAVVADTSVLHAQRLRGRSRPDAEQVAERIESMAELDPALENIQLTEQQTDSLDRIEQHYRDQFALLARDAQQSFDRRSRPSREAIVDVVDRARAMRQDELSAGRAVLTPEQQVPFDENVQRLRDEAEERTQQARRRMSGARS